MTVTELGEELGVDAGDIEVMIAVLGEHVDEELTATQAADLLDVLDAKVRLRTPLSCNACPMQMGLLSSPINCKQNNQASYADTVIQNAAVMARMAVSPTRTTRSTP